MVIVRSGRSAMIWTVQPESPETRTRTSRKPKPASTGSAIVATRAAEPCSMMRRGSSLVWVSIVVLMRSYTRIQRLVLTIFDNIPEAADSTGPFGANSR
jgi:hypothetical protein